MIFSLRASRLNFLCISHFSCVCYMFRPSHPRWFGAVFLSPLLHPIPLTALFPDTVCPCYYFKFYNKTGYFYKRVENGLRLAQPRGPPARVSVLFFSPEDGRIFSFRNVVLFIYVCNLDGGRSPRDRISRLHLETSALKLVEASRNNKRHVLVLKLVFQRTKERVVGFGRGGVGVETYKVVYGANPTFFMAHPQTLKGL